MFKVLCQQLWYYTQFVDVFGYDVKLLANGQSTYKTHIGALMSLLLLSLITYSGNSFIVEMNQGSNASLNQKEILLTESEGFTFNSSEFVFAVGVVDSVGQVIPNQNNEIFGITFYQCTKYWNETNCTFIPSVPCGTLKREMTYDYDVTAAYENVTHCMNSDYLRSIQNISLQGYQGMNTFTVFGAIVQTCQNSTKSQSMSVIKLDCAPQEVIIKYLKNFNVFYTYTTYSFNKELTEFPYVKEQNTDVSVLFENTIKYIKVFQKYSITRLEYNPFYFFSQHTYQEAIEYDKTIFDMALNIQSSNLLADISIRLSAKKQLYYVNYQTLMDVAAKIGGFYTIVRLIMQILLFPIQFVIYKLYLINRLIQQQLSCSEEFQSVNINKQIKLFQLFKEKKARQAYWQESLHVDKLLDITEILFKPLRISKQVDNLHGSLKWLDKYKKSENNQQIDDIIFDVLESRVIISPRSINQEQPANQILQSRITSIGKRT